MWLPRWLGAQQKRDDAIYEDGIGQSFADDARFIWRFRACSQRPVLWLKPGEANCAFYDGHPRIGRFGDSTIAIASVDGRTWVVRERDWYGWPDPPRFVFFAREAQGTVWSARDFSVWPQAWQWPEPSP